MRHGGDHRGSTRDRLRRKLWMLRTFGDGVMAPCHNCGHWFPAPGLEADRIVPGASYERGNLLPACRTCNAARGDTTLSHPRVPLACRLDV